MNKLFPDLKNNTLVNGMAFLNQQFNDISFFVEDEGKENLYFVIFTKLFPSIKINNIYTLKGVISVINEAKKNTKNKKKVYVVDQDFSHILDIKESISNLFYLKKYSIENYFLEKDAIIEYIIEENHKKYFRKTLNNDIQMKNIEKESIVIFKPLIQLYLIIQKYHFCIKNVKYNIEYFYNTNDFSFKENIFDNYKNSVLSRIKEIDKRKTINSIGSEFNLYLKDIDTYPGKYLLKYLYFNLKKEYKTNTEFDNFVFRLAKNSTLTSLHNDIGLDIKNYTNI